MNNKMVVLLTVLGLVLAALTYPVVAPMLDKMYDPLYTCKVEYMTPTGWKQERESLRHKSDLQVGKYVNGFIIIHTTFIEDKFFAALYHPENTDYQILCQIKGE